MRDAWDIQRFLLASTIFLCVLIDRGSGKGLVKHRSTSGTDKKNVFSYYFCKELQHKKTSVFLNVIV